MIGCHPNVFPIPEFNIYSPSLREYTGSHSSTSTSRDQLYMAEYTGLSCCLHYLQMIGSSDPRSPSFQDWIAQHKSIELFEIIGGILGHIKKDDQQIAVKMTINPAEINPINNILFEKFRPLYCVRHPIEFVQSFLRQHNLEGSANMPRLLLESWIRSYDFFCKTIGDRCIILIAEYFTQLNYSYINCLTNYLNLRSGESVMRAMTCPQKVWFAAYIDQYPGIISNLNTNKVPEISPKKIPINLEIPTNWRISCDTISELEVCVSELYDDKLLRHPN